MKVNEKILYAEIGKRLKHLRLDVKMTQSQLAEKIGVLRTSITNIESGKQKPPLSTLYSLCLVLNVEIAELLPVKADVIQKDKHESIEIGGRLDKVPPKSAEVIKRLMQE